jgi:multisubunit Na+/H+ antiporter MnhC subunit
MSSVSAVLVGVVFLLSAFLKALSFEEFAVQVSYYGIVRTPWVVIGIALGATALETGLGVGLIAGRDRARRLLPVVAGLLVFFSLLIAYAWAFQGLKDCGCFGKYLKMTPGVSILKNGVLLALVGIAWRKKSPELEWESSSPHVGAYWHVAAVVTAMAVVVGLSLFSLNRAEARHNRLNAGEPNVLAEGDLSTPSGAERIQTDESDRPRANDPGTVSSPSVSTPLSTPSESSSHSTPLPATGAKLSGKGIFSGYAVEFPDGQHELSRGLYFVAMISDSCEECAAIVKDLNALAANKDLPPLLAFVLGEGETLARFRKTFTPQFPTQLMPALEFLDRIGDAPPRFYLVKDGQVLQQWDTKRPPNEVDVLEAVLRA